MPRRLHKKVAIAHSGVYTYQRDELATLQLSEDSIPEYFRNETHFNVYRPAAVMAKAASLFARQPVVVEHPDRIITPQNAKDYMEGMTGDSVHVSYRNGEAYLDSTLTLVAEDAIRYYDEGYKEVSPGYFPECRWVSDSTTTYKGMPIHIIVTDIKEVNHLALTVAGRGGPTACVLDSKGNNMFLTDLFKSAKNLFTKDSLETAHTLLNQLCHKDITAEKAGDLIDKVVTLTTVFLASDDKTELLRYLEDLRFAADLNKEEVQAAVNIVLSLYDKLDTAAKAEVTNKKETNMPETKDTPAAVVDTAVVAKPAATVDTAAAPAASAAPAAATVDAAATQDYSPGATGVAGPGAQKMVEDGGFISELKALIAKYEGAQDAKPLEGKETPAEEKKEAEVAKATTDSAPAAAAAPVVAAVTATLDSSNAGSKGIDEFLADFRK